MESWHWFTFLGILFIVLEIFTPSFFMLPAGVAFLLTAFWSLFIQDIGGLLALLGTHLLIVYWVSYKYVWPRLTRRAPKAPQLGIVGKIATVTEAITRDGNHGYVKLYGDSWRAIAQEEFSVGEQVRIIDTEGNKVVVERTVTS